MNKLGWRLKQMLKQLGRCGLIGILLIVSAGFIYLKTKDSKADVAQLKTELMRIRTQTERADSHRADNSIVTFNQWFPTRNQLSKQLRILHQLASDQQLTIDEANYKLSPLVGSQLWRYQITFPLEADYKTIRRFTSAVMQTLPNATLGDIELTRTNAKTSNLNANLSFTIFYREAP
jgi:Tfp pilus assembly protein PilO